MSSLTTRRLIRAVLLLLMVWTVSRYFTDLAQYSTGDQRLTRSRIEGFLEKGESPIRSSSHASNVMVGVFGLPLKTLLSHYFTRYETLFGNHNNLYFPLTLQSVLCTLLLLFLCAWRFAELFGWREKYGAWAILAVAIFIGNIPILTAVSKLLKYDAISIYLSTLGALLYLEYFFGGGNRKLLLGIVALALAFYEKDTTVTVTGYIVLFEVFRRFGDAKLSFVEVAKHLGAFLLRFAALFIVVGIVLMPVTWRKPLTLFLAFEYLQAYFPAISVLWFVSLALLTVLACVAFRWAILSLSRRVSLRSVEWPRVGGAVVLALLLFSAVYQRADVWVECYLPQALRPLLATSYVGPDVMGYRTTTFDSTGFVTSFIVGISYLRLLVYMLPSYALALWLAWATLALLFPGEVKARLKGATRLNLVALFLVGFVAFHLAAYSYALVPFSERYVAQLVLALVLLSLAFSVEGIVRGANEKVFGVVAALGISIFFTSIAVGTTHFGYKNFLRSRAEENSYFLTLGVTDWTWPGWGESSYALFQYLDGLKRPVTVADDYSIPFYVPPQITAVKTEPCDWNDVDTIKRELGLNITRDKAEYLVISRVRAFRCFGPNYIIKNFRSRAAFVDERNGIQFAWLFRTDELRDALASASKL